jgi:hypothetical protein
MQSKPAQTLYAGAVTTKYGLYIVTHSLPHVRPTQKFIDRGVSLLTCEIPGCQVTFELAELISWLDEAFGVRAPSEQKMLSSHSPARAGTLSASSRG